MDIYELRIHNLKTLIGENSIKDFADAFDLDASYLSQLLNGHRRMGERAAATIERKLELPTGILGASEILQMAAISAARRFKKKGLTPPVFTNVNDAKTYSIHAEVLSDEEVKERDRRRSLSLAEAMNEDDGKESTSLAETAGVNETQAQTNVDLAELSVSSGSVPVVGKAMLGAEGYFDAIDYPTGCGDGRLMVPSTDPNAYGLRVVGSSMMPRIKNGEFVLIEPNHAYVSGDEVLIRTVDGKSMIKEFIYYRDALYRFDSVNPGTEPILLPADQIEKIHYVAGILKSSRFSPDHE